MPVDLKSCLIAQRQFFASSKTFSVEFRIQQLKALKKMIQIGESEIIAALNQDMHKHPMESEFSEILMVMNEVNYAIKNIKKWVKPIKKSTPFPMLWPGSSQVHSEPYGIVLIMSPWNYPFMLPMSPLVGAIAAGNCVILKPSEIASHSEKLIISLVNQAFPPEYIFAIHATADETEILLQEKFDYIFFTGSTHVGKLVMSAAAKHLTPVTLELGGKSPCIIDQSAHLDFACKRIVMGKMMNGGQTCIAPDYLLVHQDKKDEVIDKLKEIIKQFYSGCPERSDSFGRIISVKHFNRLKKLLEKQKILFGGDSDENTLYFSPTLIEISDLSAPIMQEEIFGPILPIITFKRIEDAIMIIKQYPNPLALYLFTHDKTNEQKIISEVSFGGGCINDCVVHIANLYLPFGGIGLSGMGKMHGKYSFDTFSHQKSIYKKITSLDFSFVYPPYNEKKRGWMRRLLF